MKKAENIILIGGSAGSYGLILNILDSIPNPISTAICVVIHRNLSISTCMEEELTLKYNRPIVAVEDKMDILENHIYFAPPGYHLLIDPSFTFSLDISEPVNFAIPSIDILFETSAQIFQENCTAFLLSGANNDGANGIRIIDSFKGSTFIQNPKEAVIDVMPDSALKLSSNAKTLTNQEIIKYFCLLS